MATRNWSGANSGNWDDNLNWDTQPVANDDIVLTSNTLFVCDTGPAAPITLHSVTGNSAGCIFNVVTNYNITVTGNVDMDGGIISLHSIGGTLHMYNTTGMDALVFMDSTVTGLVTLDDGQGNNFYSTLNGGTYNGGITVAAGCYLNDLTGTVNSPMIINGSLGGVQMTATMGASATLYVSSSGMINSGDYSALTVVPEIYGYIYGGTLGDINLRGGTVQPDIAIIGLGNVNCYDSPTMLGSGLAGYSTWTSIIFKENQTLTTDWAGTTTIAARITAIGII